MTAQDVFSALGGGVAGLLGVAVVVLAGWVVHLYEARLREHRETIASQHQQIRDQTAAIHRLADAVEAQVGRRLARGTVS